MQNSPDTSEFIKKKRLVQKSIIKLIRTDGSLIEDIENLELQLIAVKQNIYSIQYIKDPSEEAQLEAVKNYPPILDYIEDFINGKICEKIKDMLVIKDLIQ